MIAKRLAQWLSPRTREILSQLVRFGLFWSWNLVFLLLVAFAIAPYVLYELLLEVADGLLPPSLLLSALFVIAVPTVAAIVAAGPLRKQSERWLSLMYGLEAPLLCVGLFRLFVLREVTPAAGLLLVFIGLGIVAFGYTFAFGSEAKSRAAAIVRTIGAGFSLSTAAYLGLVLAFYAIPTAAWLVVGFLRFRWIGELGELISRTHGTAIVWLPMALFTFFYAASLFAVLPVMLLWLYIRQGWAVLRAARAVLGTLPVLLLVVAVPVAAELTYEGLSRQTQQAMFKLLDPAEDGNTSLQARSNSERSALLARRDEIRRGLLNGYLAPYRYLGATGSNNHIKYLWRDLCHFPDGSSSAVQSLYNYFVDPFLYRGEALLVDQSRAEALYESFFDEPLQKAERHVIQTSLAATYDRDQRQAGLVNIGQRKVWLSRQEIKVQEHGDLASIELHEVYENQTVEQQEIFYYFSLPESAVLTGLWLGDTDDLARRFPPVVAPRGAAQRVYTREVQRRADPALLEQVGPRQYRLRAFPVPPRARLSHRRFTPNPAEPAPILHLWLTYDTLAQGQSWPLPQLRERRNVYATARTERLLNGTAVPTGNQAADAWLPAALPRQASPAPSRHVVEFPMSDATLRVQIEPTPTAQIAPVLPPKQTFAVVLDRTLSMGPRSADVVASFAWLKSHIAPQHSVHVYLASAPSRHEAPSRIGNLQAFDPSSVQYFGGHRLGTLLRQFAALRGSQNYRAVLVLTDDGSMEFADDKDAIADFAAPVFFVHLGGGLAAGYDDATLATMQRRGGSAVLSLPEAFARIAENANPLSPDTLLHEVFDGYRFTVTRQAPPVAPPPPTLAKLPTAPAVPLPPTPLANGSRDPFAALAARALILGLLRQVDHGADGALDRLHAIAKTYRQVSPYSSMIVLVNDEQRQALKQAEEEKNRFERQVETGKEQLTLPNDMMVSGVPEPEEWLLLLTVGIATWFALRRA